MVRDSQGVLRLGGVDRPLLALRELCAHPHGASLDELVTRLQQPKSSTHRALAALRRAGFVQQDDDRRYHLTLEFLGLAFSFYEGLDDQALVQPLLRSLAKQFGETTHYAVLEQDQVIYVARAVPPRAFFQLAATVGGRQPAYSTGLGKILLSYALPDRDAVDRFVQEHGPLAKNTDRTITTTRALAKELEATRARGYGLDDQENEPGVNCIALPFFLGPGTRPRGAISVSAVAQRTPLADLVSRVDEMRATISEQLGPVTSPPRVGTDSRTPGMELQNL
jgi:DNA-binding IclR family transcriptional regulator